MYILQRSVSSVTVDCFSRHFKIQSTMSVTLLSACNLRRERERERERERGRRERGRERERERERGGRERERERERGIKNCDIRFKRRTLHPTLVDSQTSECWPQSVDNP